MHDIASEQEGLTQPLLSKLYYQSLKLDWNYNLINFVIPFSKNHRNRRKLALAVWNFAFDIHILYMKTKNARQFGKARSLYSLTNIKHGDCQRTQIIWGFKNCTKFFGNHRGI